MLVLPHGLMRLRQLGESEPATGVDHIDHAGRDPLLHFSVLAGRIEMGAADFRRRHENSTLAHPDLWRVETKAATLEILRIADHANVGLDQ